MGKYDVDYSGESSRPFIFENGELMSGYALNPEITQKVKEMTDSQVSISPGTMYGTLSKMEKDGLVSFVREEEKRKIYQITDLGRKVLEIELKRIERLYRNSREEL